MIFAKNKKLAYRMPTIFWDNINVHNMKYIDVILKYRRFNTYICI